MAYWSPSILDMTRCGQVALLFIWFKKKNKNNFTRKQVEQPCLCFYDRGSGHVVFLPHFVLE